MSEIDLPPGMPDWIAEHIRLYRKDPEKAHLWDASLGGGQGLLTTLLLTSTGRKSGKPRSLPLIYQKDGDRYVVIASKGGAPDHPSWYKNLVDHPACHVQVAKDKFDAVARTAQGEERERLWQTMAKAYPPYDDYQEAAGGREIPVVILERT